MQEQTKLSVATQAVLDIAEAGAPGLGILDVWYGEQLRIPRTPALAVESSFVEWKLDGVGAQGRTRNTFTIFVIGYISKLQDNQITRKAVDEMMEDVAALYTADTTWGGAVIYGLPVSYEPGYTTRQGESFRVGRLTLEGMTKTNVV